MATLLQLLGHSSKVNKNGNIDAQYQKCKEQIKCLVERIRGKLEEHDDEFLMKFNDQFGASDIDEAKYSEQRPAQHFPIKAPKGSARFAVQRTLRGHVDKIYALRWSTDSTHLVSASKDGSLVIWNMEKGTKELGIPLRVSWVMTVDYSPDGSMVASGGLDNLCSVFSIEDEVGWAANTVCSLLYVYKP